MKRDELVKNFLEGKKMRYADFKKAVAEKVGVSVYSFENEIRKGYKPYITSDYLRTYPLEYFRGREEYLASIIEELISYEAAELGYHIEQEKQNVKH